MKLPEDFGLPLFLQGLGHEMDWSFVDMHTSAKIFLRYPPLYLYPHFLVYWSRQHAAFFIIDPVLRIRIRDPVVFDPGSGIQDGKNPRPFFRELINSF
jgi:hypothetical protein